jgi:hypothetical protein
MIRSRVAALTALYLLVVCAVGMLHPVRNALVLGALGGQGFYKVYVASALVALAVVPFGRLAARVPQQRLTPAVAAVFAANLLMFRAFFPGGMVFGILFYAWHDLFAGILVSQFFLAANTLLDARSAKSAFPVIVAAGSVGAAVGGAITGFLSPIIGVANLLVVAAVLTAVFAAVIPLVLGDGAPEVRPNVRIVSRANQASLREVLGDRQVQLIAATVVLTVLVKQLVDYQFNLATATLGDREAISAFQGKFAAATQWLPLVAAAAIRPALARWGIGAALLMLPASMVAANLFVGLRAGLGPAAFAKGTETTLRYSAERTGREILYMPVSDAIRVKAKPWIDVGLESGLAKALSAGVIFVLIAAVGASRLAWPAVALSVLWLGAAIAERRAYVRALASGLRAPELEPALLAAILRDTGEEVVVKARTPASDSEGEVHALVSTLRDASGDLSARRRAVHGLRELGGPDAIAALLGAAADGALELVLRTDALHALRRLRDDSPTASVAIPVVQEIVTEHLGAAERYAAAGAVVTATASGDRDQLLGRSITEAWQTRQAAVFDGIGVIHEPRVVDGCYRAITGSDERRRAEALELIEESASRPVVRRFEPILRAAPDYGSLGVSQGRADVIATLRRDEDQWVAQCAAYADTGGGAEPMEVIERVFLLQRVEIFSDTPSHHLARIALLAKEVEADAGALLLRGTERADAMYVVIDGELRGEWPGRATRPVGSGEAVGALAILDDAPIGLDVRVVRKSRLLRLTRRDLRDLLHDHPDLAVSLLRGTAARLRWLVELAVHDGGPDRQAVPAPITDRSLEQEAPPL